MCFNSLISSKIELPCTKHPISLSHPIFDSLSNFCGVGSARPINRAIFVVLEVLGQLIEQFLGVLEVLGERLQMLFL